MVHSNFNPQIKVKLLPYPQVDNVFQLIKIAK